MVDMKWDFGDIPKNAQKLIKDMIEGVEDATWSAVTIIGNESEKQVPFDVGTLRDSWRVEPLKEQIGYEIGYHTDYAARLHEHPEYHFQNHRKAKYLSDPIDLNLGDWQGVIKDKLKKVLK